MAYLSKLRMLTLTINQGVKTTGGIEYFANDSKSILKCTLNGSVEANNTLELLLMVDMKPPKCINC